MGSELETDVQTGFGSMDSVRRPTHDSVRCEDRRASIVNHAHALRQQLLLFLLRRSPARTMLGSPGMCSLHWQMHSYFERVVFFCFCLKNKKQKKLIFICFICIFFITLLHRQPRAIFGGFVRLSGEMMLLHKEFIVAEDSPHITMQRITTFYWI